MPSDNNSNPPHTPPELPSGLNIVHSSPPGTPKMKDGPEPAPLTRAELLDSAQKFLESAPIMNAPLREKLEFLKTKGLTRDEMEALLEKLAEKEAGKGVVVVGGKKEEEERKEKEKEGGKADKGKGKELVKASSSTSTSTSTSTAVVPTKPAPPPPPPPAAPRPRRPHRHLPRIPHPRPPAPPAPLMTAKTLGKSLYFATGAAATIYGANKFVLTPMYDALTSARLDLASTALTNLATLNTRLTELLPEGATIKPRRADSDSDSDTSDPGELFHVDASTQTSADLGADLADGAELSPDGKLERLGAQLQTLVESHSDGTDNELTFALEDLTSYLETLTYEWPGTNIYTSPYGGYGGGAGGKEKDKDDPVAKVKAEIRSVKGVLLNSKNFPASR
ncbi:uncharacterized protein LAJ45_03118 [Morchella importuna]|uniref:uncharacterized protein n=1 Tax=Morchella importuna TaxID=1174673 RepID=UPI001E8D0AD1|nr:uncharacterized protein LAJ45_03118 [Morchella importuna]KAH8152892.1 hypothetical protein LAJ45_03118 [Morchella importuna]